MMKTDEVSEQLPCSRSGTKMDENGAGLASIAYGRENPGNGAGDKVGQTLVP
jgi:hypothetical protein